MGSLLGDHVLDWDPERPCAKYERNKVLQFCPGSQLVFSPAAKKRIFITGALRKDAAVWMLGAGACKTSGMFRAYKCPLTGLFSFSISRSSIFIKSRPHLRNVAGPTAGRQSWCDHGLGSSCPLSHSSGGSALVITSIHFSADKLG